MDRMHIQLTVARTCLRCLADAHSWHAGHNTVHAENGQVALDLLKAPGGQQVHTSCSYVHYRDSRCMPCTTQFLMQLAEPCMSSCSSFGLTLISTLQRFDLILLDIVMPVMDGVELLTILQSEQYLRHIPVVSDQE